MQGPTLEQLPRAAAVQAPPKTNTLKLIVATSLGNGLEMFDFTVYSFFAMYIAAAFFPAQDPLTSLLLAVGTFGAGFFARPLGAMLIGSYADRVGRRSAMTLTIWLMAVGTCAIGLCPTYAQIGLAAPLIVLCGRLLQGFSAGGEVGASTTLLMEAGPRRRRGFMISWQITSQGVAAVSGALMGLLLSRTLAPADLANWGWRLPFMAGLLIAPVGYYIRRKLPDEHEHAAGAPMVASPITELLSRYRGQLLTAIFIGVGGTVSMYALVFFLPSYLSRVMHMPATLSFSAALLASVMITLMSPVAGILADRVKRRKQLAMVIGVLSSCFTLPAFWLITHGAAPPVVLGVIAAMVGLMTLGTGNGVVMMMEVFPPAVRASGFAMAYAICVTLFGGTAQFAVTALVAHTHQPFSAGEYVFACNLVSLLAVLAYREKWRVAA